MDKRRAALPLAFAGLLAGAVLAGCGGSGDAGAPSTSSASASPSVTGGGTGPGSGTSSASSGGPSGYPSAAAGLDLTAPGTALRLGQAATVAWQPTQQLVGALQVDVTAAHSTTFARSFRGWQLDDATRADAPYFVTATVRNVGRTDLSGRPVPLYGAAATGALIEASTFASDFKPCGPSTLPTPFAPGARATVCLVYLVPAGGHLDGVTFRPTEGFDPITWRGEVSPLAPPPGTGSPSGASSASAAPR